MNGWINKYTIIIFLLSSCFDVVHYETIRKLTMQSYFLSGERAEGTHGASIRCRRPTLCS